MSIAVLNQVYDETRRLAIAGSGLAVGDFRLQKLVEPLRKAGEKAPVFAKVAESIERLVDGDEASSPQALLDLSSLVLAIIYTQGQTGTKGTAQPIETVDLNVSTTQVSSRVLKPLMEALTTTGSGRLETVQDAFRRGAFKDLRLVNPSINALDDVYPELADFIAEKVLPGYGTAILPEIKNGIDIQGKAGNVRRLKLLYKLDPKTARPFVEKAFENGSKEMKIAALACLGDSKQDLPHLLEQARAKAKDVRQVAFERLTKFKGKDVEAAFEKALSSADVELVVVPVSQTTNTKLIGLAQQQTESCLQELAATKDQKKMEKLYNRLDSLLCCFYGRTEKSTIGMLQSIYVQRSELLKGRVGSAILDRLCSVMVASGDKKLLQLAAGLHTELDGKAVETFCSSVLAVLATRSPKQAFDELHGYYKEDGNRRRVSSRSEVVEGLLCGKRNYQYHYMRNLHVNGGTFEIDSDHRFRNIQWDPRWLDLAIEKDDTRVVCSLATAQHTEAGDYMVGYLAESEHKRDDLDTVQVVAKLVEIQHPQVTSLLLDVVTKWAKDKRPGYWLSCSVLPLISKLPKTSAKMVEAALQELPESLVDEIMPHLMTLKQKTK